MNSVPKMTYGQRKHGAFHRFNIQFGSIQSLTDISGENSSLKSVGEGRQSLLYTSGQRDLTGLTIQRPTSS